MTEEDRERKKKEKKQQDALEAFFLAVLESMARAAVEAAFNEMFGQPRRTIPLDEWEASLYGFLEGEAEEAIEDLFAEWQ